MMKIVCIVPTAIALIVAGAIAGRAANDGQSNEDWTAYAHDLSGSHFSPLTQIDKANVAKLTVAWTFHTGALSPASDMNEKATFEAIPLVVDRTLFVSTAFDQVFALDPTTGESRWEYDPQVDRTQGYSEVTSRGVATWLDFKAATAAICRRRIFIGTIDARMIAIDAKTGKPCQDFADHGQLNLSAGVDVGSPGDYQETSPPVVVNDLLIVGSSVGDNGQFFLARGTVRAFSPRTGQLLWSWEPLVDVQATGSAAVWSQMSADPRRDLVFLPTESASPDFFGGLRIGRDLYSDSVVALRASTGKFVWGYQVVHHDLWDYDIASQPVLFDWHGRNKSTPAVAVTTKMGNLFILDRLTGKPLLPVEERPVPQTDIPGEQTWPTQPFTSNPPLAPQTLTPDDAWGVTPEDKAWCRERIASLRSDGIFTPPSVRGSILFPGNLGGVAWGGPSYDPAHGILFANTNRLATMVRLIPRSEYESQRRDGQSKHIDGEFARQDGTAFGMFRQSLLSPHGAPCNAPPWATLAAVDLTTGAKRWEVPLGTSVVNEQVINGSVGLGGSLVTAGGLIFIAGSHGDQMLRAFDVRSGAEVWQSELPAGGQSTPMTYAIAGKEYVVIAAGGHGKFGTKQGDELVAYALP